MLKYFVYIFFINVLFSKSNCERRWCKPSVTTASGSAIRSETICAGDTIFEDKFDFFDRTKWDHESTLSGGGNYEFQWYVPSSKNSYVENGKLFITPTLTADEKGASFLTSGLVDLNESPDRCTYSLHYGCRRQGNAIHIINPVRSAKLTTKTAFSFKYGHVKVKAKMPSGDWLWPAIWLYPKQKFYGQWPTSGEIDIVESRGNKNLRQDGVNIGSKQVSSTLHFGPRPELDGYRKTLAVSRSRRGFDKDFHIYELIWHPEFIKFKVDGADHGEIIRADDGFWKKDNFLGQNPWKNGGLMAPFDKEFFLNINLAVGGINGYFPDNAQNKNGKPWLNTSPNAAKDFWDGRIHWLRTWTDPSFVIDYIEVLETWINCFLTFNGEHP